MWWGSCPTTDVHTVPYVHTISYLYTCRYNSNDCSESYSYACAYGHDGTHTTTVSAPKEAIRWYSRDWYSLELNNAIAAYVVENGYEYPVDMVEAGTMKVALAQGEIEVVLEVWRQDIMDWYQTEIAAGNIVDLAGTVDNVTNGAPGQILENSTQGFYIPPYTAEANPGLKSVSDLPDYVDLFIDPEEPSKGVLYNCIIGWQCQKINRAKWAAYGLYDTYNVISPGTSGGIDAARVGAVTAEVPVLSYYWEPTTIVNELGLVRLEEPEWTQECQDALDAGVASNPYESTIGCAYPTNDVHSAVHSGLVERAPEVTTFLANFFVGALNLGSLEVWRNDNDAEYSDVAIHYLKENRDVWTTWITDDNASEIIARVDAALAAE